MTATITSFISQGYKENAQKTAFEFKPTQAEIAKLEHSIAEQTATLAGAKKLAAFLNVGGILDDIADMVQAFNHFYDTKDLKPRDGAKMDASDRHNWERYNQWKMTQTAIAKLTSIVGRVEKGAALAH